MTSLQTMRDEVSAQLGVTMSKARGAVDIIMDTLRAELLVHGQGVIAWDRQAEGASGGC